MIGIFSLCGPIAIAAIKAKQGAEAQKVISIEDRKAQVQKRKEQEALVRILKRAKEINW